MTEPILKPCPFCGNEGTLVTRKGKNGFRDNYCILCDYDFGGCGAEGGHYHSIGEAIDAWNARTEDVWIEPCPE